MSSARKGRRASRRAPRSLQGREGRRERAQALAQRLIESTASNTGIDVSEEALVALEDVVSKITHTTRPDLGEVCHLDNEYLCEHSDDENDHQTTSSSSQGSQLEHHIDLAAGRSSIHRRRANYFPSVPEVREEEQTERSVRSEEANLRKATIRAVDVARSEDCALWVTLTVDDLHEGQLSPKEVSSYFAKVSRKHRRRTGEHLHYVGVIGTHGNRTHVHALLSRDTDRVVVRDAWPFGAEAEIIEIQDDMIEAKVRYMANNIRDFRLSVGRFFRSRGARSEKLVMPVESVEEAREQLVDLIGPDQPRLVSAQPFGGNPRYSFRFTPLREQGDG